MVSADKIRVGSRVQIKAGTLQGQRGEVTFKAPYGANVSVRLDDNSKVYCAMSNLIKEEFSVGEVVDTPSGPGPIRVVGIQGCDVDVKSGRDYFYYKDITKRGSSMNPTTATAFNVGDRVRVLSIGLVYDGKEGTVIQSNQSFARVDVPGYGPTSFRTRDLELIESAPEPEPEPEEEKIERFSPGDRVKINCDGGFWANAHATLVGVVGQASGVNVWIVKDVGDGSEIKNPFLSMISEADITEDTDTSGDF